MKSENKSAASLEMGGFFSAISAPAKAMSMTNANIAREYSVGPQPNTSTTPPNTSVPNTSTPNTSSTTTPPNSPATRRNRRQSGGKSRRRHRKSRTRRH